MNPNPTLTREELSPEEQRVVFDTGVAFAGRQTLFTNPLSETVEVVELMVLPVAANRVSILVNDTKITPAWDLAARQSMSEHGFRVPPGGKVEIHNQSSGETQALLIWRTLLQCPNS